MTPRPERELRPDVDERAGVGSALARAARRRRIRASPTVATVGEGDDSLGELVDRSGAGAAGTAAAVVGHGAGVGGPSDDVLARHDGASTFAWSACHRRRCGGGRGPPGARPSRSPGMALRWLRIEPVTPPAMERRGPAGGPMRPGGAAEAPEPARWGGSPAGAWFTTPRFDPPATPAAFPGLLEPSRLSAGLASAWPRCGWGREGRSARRRRCRPSGPAPERRRPRSAGR